MHVYTRPNIYIYIHIDLYIKLLEIHGKLPLKIVLDILQAKLSQIQKSLLDAAYGWKAACFFREFSPNKVVPRMMNRAVYEF